MSDFEFSERLYELMLINNLTILELAKKSRCSKTAISTWLNFNIYPSLKNLIKLANFFGCSSDYLVGLTDNSNVGQTYEFYRFIERLAFLVKQNNTSYYKIAKDLNIDERNFTRWKKDVIPSTETLIRLAKYFGTSLDFLIGREN